MRVEYLHALELANYNCFYIIIRSYKRDYKMDYNVRSKAELKSDMGQCNRIVSYINEINIV